MRSRTTTLYCFTPFVTLLTFVVEAFLGLVALVKYRRTEFGRLCAFLIALLAIFQLSEFVICQERDVIMWVMIGWVSITFIPVIGLHAISLVTERTAWLLPGYAIAAGFSLIFVALPGFVNSATCTGNYVSFSFSSSIFHPLYTIFYFGYLLLGMIMLAQAWERRKKERELFRWFLIGYTSFMVPTFIVYVLTPAPREAFPSVFCGFAVFLAIVAVGKILPLAQKYGKAK